MVCDGRSSPRSPCLWDAKAFWRSHIDDFRLLWILSSWMCFRLVLIHLLPTRFDILRMIKFPHIFTIWFLSFWFPYGLRELKRHLPQHVSTPESIATIVFLAYLVLDSSLSSILRGHWCILGVEVLQALILFSLKGWWRRCIPSFNQQEEQIKCSNTKPNFY